MAEQSRFARTRARTARARHLRRTVSRTEARLWPHLRNSQLGAPFRRQHPIGPITVDYCCVPLKLVVEIDGPLHERDEDRRRDEHLNTAGWTVMRFTMEDMDERLEAVVETIHDRVALLKLEVASRNLAEPEG
jgi:very-short-patch-repair endonuclease